MTRIKQFLALSLSLLLLLPALANLTPAQAASEQKDYNGFTYNVVTDDDSRQYVVLRKYEKLMEFRLKRSTSMFVLPIPRQNLLRFPKRSRMFGAMLSIIGRLWNRFTSIPKMRSLSPETVFSMSKVPAVFASTPKGKRTAV